MIRRNHIQHLLFFSCVSILILSYWASNSSNDPNIEFIKLVLFTFPSIYILVYASHMITIQHFNKLKKFFYEDRLRSIENLITDKQRIREELGDNFLSGILINFFVIYFLSIVTPTQLLTKLPGMENVEIKELPETVGLIIELLQMPRIEYLAPFIVIGFIIIYILKFLHRRKIHLSKFTINQTDVKKYPGTTALLGFLYTTLAIMIIQLIANVFGWVENAQTVPEYLLTFVISGVFATMGSFAITIVVITDHYLFRRFQPDNTDSFEID